MKKTQKECNEIQKRWNLRCMKMRFASALPQGYTVTNTNPIQKEISKNGSLSEIHWTCWVRNGKETSLAILSGNHVKLISKKELNNYNIHSIKD
ncbi:MAG: hypothetical protein E7012_03675 [Alphaproteobacteria bacterium]|nr:hypothetical protein [Alphaproteobacteria bacterium]